MLMIGGQVNDNTIIILRILLGRAENIFLEASVSTCTQRRRSSRCERAPTPCERLRWVRQRSLAESEVGMADTGGNATANSGSGGGVSVGGNDISGNATGGNANANGGSASG